MDSLKDNKLGFVFELGFNIGLLSKIEEYRKEGRAEIGEAFLLFIKNKLMDKDYFRERFYKLFTHQIVDVNIKYEIKKNIDYLLYKGIISGKNFFKEFIDVKVKAGKSFEIFYFQADFNNPLNLEFKGERDIDYYYELISKQFKINIDKQILKEFSHKGEFLKADSLFVIKVRKKYHLCVVDNGISLSNISELSNIETIKKKLIKTINKVKSKSVFSDLNLEVDKVDFLVSKNLSNYAQGLGGKDKPLLKIIQAGSYAHSFLSFLYLNNILKKEDITSVNITGYTDEEVGSINISNENYTIIDELKGCFADIEQFYEEYKNFDRQNRYSSYDEKKDIVFKNLRKNFKKSFNINGKFAEEFSLTDGINKLSFEEVINNYQNTANNYLLDGKEIGFREAHGLKINQYLNRKDIQLIFLTGNPGIGKTTALMKFLEDQDSYLFVYVSPRTQVNKDIENKLKSKDDKLKDDDILYLTANGNDESYIDDKEVEIINYTSNNNIYDNIKSPIMFLKNDRKRLFSNERVKFKHLNNVDFTDSKIQKSGVLNRLTRAIDHVIQNDLSNKIVATAAIQSLKLVGEKGTTAKHFSKIFSSIYNLNSACIDIGAARAFAKKYKNIIFMVDEITGDQSGVRFLDELITQVYKNIIKKIPEEIKSEINFKIVVADASITDENVINRHIDTTSVDNDKIYFSNNISETEPLVAKEFIYKNKYDSVIINTNSYPAKKVHFKYKPCIEVRKNDEVTTASNDLAKVVDDLIIKDAIEYLLSKEHEQVIIYIQNISRLDEIKCRISEIYFEVTKEKLNLKKDILTISSAMSERERNEVNIIKENAKFILMTSSASRGISFEKTTAILVDVPRFNVESNLMEIIQLIYRGRGNINYDINKEKYINFYLQEKIIYGDDRKSEVNNGLVSILSLMIILKTSILTRINGYCNIANKSISLIPIGGKGVSGVGQLLIEDVTDLIKSLNKEYCKDMSQIHIKGLINSLASVFNFLKLQTDNSVYRIDLNNIKMNFYDIWDKGLDNLIEFNPFHDAIIIGDIAIFKISDKINSQTNFNRSTIVKLIEKENFMKMMYAMSESEKYTDTLRTQLNKVYKILCNAINDKEDVSRRMVEIDNDEDRYVAVPLITPFLVNEFTEYYKNIEIENTFKDILESYVKAHYSINSVLPLTPGYEEYPYISFKSSVLEPIRKKKFHDKYLFCSKEINLINLLLTKD